MTSEPTTKDDAPDTHNSLASPVASAVGESQTFSRARLFVPLSLFVLIVLMLLFNFSILDPENSQKLPSALLNKPFPEFSASTLADPERVVTTKDLVGRVVLVNVWATWCPTCLAEHGELQRISQTTQVPIIGVNYKDDRRAAQEWLRRYGNPYEFNIEDVSGQLGVELGVYGAPETFLLNAAGEIVYKRVGDINPRIWRDELAPALRELGIN